MKHFVAFVILALFSVSAVASDDFAGLWYNPDKPGHGIQINRDGGFGHAITWYLYRKDGSSAFVTALETCEEFPCVVSLAEPTARFLDGDAELGDAVGSVELTPQEDGSLEVDYDLSLFLGADHCYGISPGGMIFRQCVGKFDMIKLAD